MGPLSAANVVRKYSFFFLNSNNLSGEKIMAAEEY